MKAQDSSMPTAFPGVVDADRRVAAAAARMLAVVDVSYDTGPFG